MNLYYILGVKGIATMWCKLVVKEFPNTPRIGVVGGIERI
jgi:hypothetical protein